VATSDRTSRVNAALTGLGRTRRIILSDTLLSDYRPEEVEAVLAHEMAHHVNHDIWKGLAVDAAAGLAACLAADAALRAAAAGPAGLQGLSDPAGLPWCPAMTAAWLVSRCGTRCPARTSGRVSARLIPRDEDAFASASAPRREEPG
jgi:Zn-dependent protease with chaperone function